MCYFRVLLSGTTANTWSPMKNKPLALRHLFGSFLIVLFLYRPASPEKISGAVTDSRSGSPIPGVLVSLGYGLHRTLTDADGRFSLEVPHIAVRQGSLPHPLRPAVTMITDRGRGSLDLTHSPQTGAVSIFRLNGSRFFHRTWKTWGSCRRDTTAVNQAAIYIPCTRYFGNPVQYSGVMRHRLSLSWFHKTAVSFR